MTRWLLVVCVVPCIHLAGCQEPVGQTQESRKQKARPDRVLPAVKNASRQPSRPAGRNLPAITIVDRKPLRPESVLVYDDLTRSWKPPTEPRIRPERTADGKVPVGLSLDEAKAFVLKQIRTNFRVSRDEFRLRGVTTVYRGLDLPYIGWNITYEQVFMGTAISSDQLMSRVNEISASVFNDDDYDMSIHLSDVTPFEGTEKPILSEEQAKRIARSCLYVDESKPHTFERLEVVYSPLAESQDRLTPVWKVEIDIPLDLATVKSYLLAHRGGVVGIDAWTGKIVSGSPMKPGWPEDASHWDELQKAAGEIGDDVPEAIRKVVGRIIMGMYEDEVESLMHPIALATANTYPRGSGAFEMYYQLADDTQLKVYFGGSYSLYGKVVHVDYPHPKEEWNGLFFTPDNEDASKAIEIAVAHLKAQIAEGVVLSEKFKTSPAGRLVSPELPQRTVELDETGSGETKKYTVTASGRYVKHRLVELDFVSDGRWTYQVVVDMDDGIVVPTK